MGKPSEADPADTELSEVTTGPAAYGAPVIGPYPELWGSLVFLNKTLLGHPVSLSSTIA